MTTQTQSYFYDANGNMIKDYTKGIYDTIVYNHLNKPELIDFGNGEKIRYFYDGNGNKLAKQVLDGDAIPGSSVLYSGNFIYDWNGNLLYILTGDGRLVPEGERFRFEYFMKDHLGNTRAVYAPAAPGLPQIAEYTHYYPFGMQLEQLSYISGADVENDYLYNGKEIQKDYGLEWYDYGARFYDPVILRFTTQDRFAERYVDFTPYQYAANNPIKFIDVNGDSILVNSGGQEYYYGYTEKYGYGMYDKSGQLYSGNDKNLNTVTEALARLSLGKEGKALVEDLMSSTKNSVQIVNRKGAVNGADTEKGEYIIWDSQNTNGGPDQAGNATRESFIGLGHEMSHVQDIWNGTINNETWQRVTDAKGNPVEIPYAEIYATHKENQVRAENGVPLRVSYAKDTNNNPDPSTRIIRAGTSESIYYQQNGTTRYSPLKKDQVPYKY